MENIIKISLLIVFVIIIPVSAVLNYYSRSAQRHSEVKRYLSILNIKKVELFELKHPVVSLSTAVAFVTLLSVCFWYLVLFGEESGITNSANYLLGGANNIGLASAIDQEKITAYQSGALLTFNMAFLGAYLWGIQNIARRYSMNDLIPAAYYNIGVRMIFSCLLALVFYHLSKMIPGFSLSMVTDSSQAQGAVSKDLSDVSAQKFMPIIAFLLGMFPERGIKWLTGKFSIFSKQIDNKDISVRELPIQMIEGISTYDQIRLQELGIDSCYDLANIDCIPYLFKSPYTPRILINWILQAKLCVYFGQNVKELRDHGIHTIWQLKNYKAEDLKELAKKTALTEDMLLLVNQQVSEDKEIERLIEAQLELSKYWNKKEEN